MIASLLNYSLITKESSFWSKSLTVHKSSKHNDILFHYVQQQYDETEIDIKYMCSNNNAADIFHETIDEGKAFIFNEIVKAKIEYIRLRLLPSFLPYCTNKGDCLSPHWKKKKKKTSVSQISPKYLENLLFVGWTQDKKDRRTDKDKSNLSPSEFYARPQKLNIPCSPSGVEYKNYQRQTTTYIKIQWLSCKI